MLWPRIGIFETSLSGHVKHLLKYCDPHSKGDNMIFIGVDAVLRKTNDKLKNQYYSNHTSQFTQDMHSNCIEKNLNLLLPMISISDGEAELKAMSKDCKESSLQLIRCFQAMM